jgi:hypothetical protein
MTQSKNVKPGAIIGVGAVCFVVVFIVMILVISAVNP